VKPGELLAAAVVLAIGIVVVGDTVYFLRQQRRNSKLRRGFEVKLNSGDEPEPQKKENDHG
jgi:hypothetical protein